MLLSLRHQQGRDVVMFWCGLTGHKVCDGVDMTAQTYTDSFEGTLWAMFQEEAKLFQIEAHLYAQQWSKGRFESKVIQRKLFEEVANMSNFNLNKTYTFSRERFILADRNLPAKMKFYFGHSAASFIWENTIAHKISGYMSYPNKFRTR